MKGVAIIWVNILAGIFIVGLLYIIMSYVLYAQIQPFLLPAINASTNNSTGVNATAVVTTINLIQIVWIVWPLIFIFGLVLYGIVASQKREPEQYYY